MLSLLPKCFFTIITVLVILWLTLAPKPLGDEPPQLFPGADKIVHAIMFGGLVWMLLLDWQRIHKWAKVKWPFVIINSISVSFLGIAIEFAQSYMGLGRGFEYADIIADAVGSFLFGAIWVFLQKFWCPKSL